MTEDNFAKELKKIITEIKKDILLKQFQLDLLTEKMEDN